MKKNVKQGCSKRETEAKTSSYEKPTFVG